MKLNWLDLKGNILIAGCGGGYDVYTGLPLYFAIKALKLNHNIYLANLSFTDSSVLKDFPNIGSACYEVNDNNKELNISCIEYKLSKAINEPIYCFSCCDINDFSNSYKLLVEKHNITTILVCDGGCDSIFSGIEYELGTPVEDMITLWAIDKLNLNTYLILLGANVDTFGDVRYQDMVENMDKLKELNAIIDIQQLESNMLCVKSYMDVMYQVNDMRSIVNCCILSSLEKQYGNHHHKLLGDRCRLGEFNINADTSKYYILDFKKVISHIKYLDKFDNYKTDDDIDEYIMQFNKKHNPNWKDFNCNIKEKVYIQ
jgi:hypothetical protein